MDYKILIFENYDLPKKYAYEQNKKYFNELQGENNYEKIFFIQYLFKPDLTSFSDTNLKITFDEFNQFMNEDINQFDNLKIHINAIDLIKRLKWP